MYGYDMDDVILRKDDDTGRRLRDILEHPSLSELAGLSQHSVEVIPPVVIAAVCTNHVKEKRGERCDGRS